MYITRVEIQNIRSIEHLVWEIDAGQAAGWHVILGDNGSGKSTFVRSVALSLIGELGAVALLLNVTVWLRRGKKVGKVFVEIANDLSYSRENKKGHLRNWIPRRAGFELNAADSAFQMKAPGSPKFFLEGQGWFCASFGSFRRFASADNESNALQKFNPFAARHSSLFNDEITLTEGMHWLRGLKFEELENKGKSAELLETVVRFINQPGLLTNGVSIQEVTSAGVRCKDGNGVEVGIEDLGDGYRSLLSMTFELLRQLSIVYGPEDIFINNPDGSILIKVPGVVQIDEVDAHLHPTWQKQIGFWLTKHFPNIQFIVTTHSPLVCQAAERGTIFRLPTPGTDEKGQMLEGQDRDRLLYGDILDAYSTQAFGYGVTRSETSHKMLDRLSDLNLKEMMEGLSSEETTEQRRLQEALPTTASALPNGFRS